MRAKSLWAGRLLLLLGLAAWLWQSWSLLPYNYLDLAYLFSLEQGFILTQVWVHPLFMPLLQALAWLLRLCGHSGHMLMPLETLNAAAGAATAAALYAVLERRGAEPLRAAGLLLALAFSHGYWEGVLRPTPYALAGAALSVCLLALTSSPARVGLAGAAAGAAAGLHLSALALLPAGWLCLAKGERRRFAAGFVLVLAGSYAVMLRCAPAELNRLPSFDKLFLGVEQMPHSSLYTNPRLWDQAAAYFGTLARHGGAAGLLILAAALGGWLWKRRGARPEMKAGAAAAAAFAAFFFINNSQNGFVYSSVLALAPAAAAAPLPGAASAGLAAAGTVAAALSAARSLSDGPADDAQFVESRFISRLVGPRGLLVVPGCPAAELFHERFFAVLDIGPAPSPEPCLAPYSADPTARLERALASGRRAWVSFGDLETDFGGDLSGTQKLHQIFETSLLKAADRRRLAQQRRAALERSFRLRGPALSPAGRPYWELRLRRQRPKPAQASSGWDPVLLRLWSRNVRDPGLRSGIAYLATWLESSPEDGDARADLVALYARKLAPRLAGSAQDQALAAESARQFDRFAGV
ncbi:MAG: hypothetical protein HY926_08165, partial [Elusimicrobia bacterium]|nr:hypothetical protein [Elusimicrobiota bacterium]